MEIKVTEKPGTGSKYPTFNVQFNKLSRGKVYVLLHALKEHNTPLGQEVYQAFLQALPNDVIASADLTP